ncbi:MAG: HAMP domain-containing histidine kinase, partial [Syntrophales bacterium]
MLSLRKKLLLGFGGLLLIIVLLGLQSITKVTELGGAIDIILRENYQSVIACQKMKESLERLDSGTLFILSGYKKEGKDIIERNMPEFEKALQTELKNITLPGEGERVSHIKILFEQYRPLIIDVEGQKLSQPVRNEIYFDELLPLFWDI